MPDLTMSYDWSSAMDSASQKVLQNDWHPSRHHIENIYCFIENKTCAPLILDSAPENPKIHGSSNDSRNNIGYDKIDVTGLTPYDYRKCLEKGLGI